MEKPQLIENGADLAVIIGADRADGLEDCEIGLLLCPVTMQEWNRVLSPWPAEPVFKKTPPFEGRADEWIDTLIPQIRQAKERCGGKLYVCGYSLAGLFSLYLCTRWDLFDGCASVSGSLWYPGWTEWLREHPVQCSRVYLSVGEREKNSRNPRMRTVEDCTRGSAEMISGYSDVWFERNPGGHFEDEAGRLRKAVDWLVHP